MTQQYTELTPDELAIISVALQEDHRLLKEMLSFGEPQPWQERMIKINLQAQESVARIRAKVGYGSVI